MALCLSIRRRDWGSGGCGGTHPYVLTETHCSWADGVSGLNCTSSFCAPFTNHPSPPDFTGGSWLVRLRFGMFSSLITPCSEGSPSPMLA